MPVSVVRTKARAGERRKGTRNHGVRRRRARGKAAVYSYRSEKEKTKKTRIDKEKEKEMVLRCDMLMIVIMICIEVLYGLRRAEDLTSDNSQKHLSQSPLFYLPHIPLSQSSLLYTPLPPSAPHT